MPLPTVPDSMSTTQFIKLFSSQSGILKAFILPADDSGKSDDIFSKLFFNEEVSTDELLSVPTRFIDGVLNVYGREIYAEDCKAREEESYLPLVSNPFVDLTTKLVFDCDWGGHEVVANAFMQVRGAKTHNFSSWASDYILQGHGYYVSSVSMTGLAVGKIAFDKNLLDEYDAMIMNLYKIHVIECRSDFLDMKGR